MCSNVYCIILYSYIHSIPACIWCTKVYKYRIRSRAGEAVSASKEAMAEPSRRHAHHLGGKLGGHHHHRRHHHHHHHHGCREQESVLTLLKQHRADTRWRREQSTNDLGDNQAANEIEAQHIDKAGKSLAESIDKGKVGDEASGTSSVPPEGSRPKAKKNAFGGRRRKSQAEMMVVKPSMLSKVDLCRGLGSQSLALLSASFLVRPYRRGHIFTTRGEASNLMFVILSGRISVQIDKTEVATLDPISVFG